MQAWTAFGRLPATGMFLGTLAAALLGKLLLPPDLASMLGVSLLVAFIAYCIARPADRFAVFGAMAFPGATATMAEDLLGVSGTAVGLALLPVALLAMLAIDHDEDARDDASSPA